MGDQGINKSWLFTAGELEQTPSIKAGMSLHNERLLRQKSILFILELGRYLSCNHLVISSASIMFHRFMACQAFQTHDRFIVSATCVFLAGKVEEQPKRLKDVVDTFLLIRYNAQKKFIESELKLLQDKILVAERILLQTLGFDLQLNHPYGYCMHLLKSHKTSFTSDLVRNDMSDESRKELNEEARKEVKKLAMNFLTDSFCGVLCLEFDAEVIATAVIFLAILSRGLPPPGMASRGGVFRRGLDNAKTSNWMDLLLSASKGNVTELDLKTCCTRVIEVYEDIVISKSGSEGNSQDIKGNNLLRMKLEEAVLEHLNWLSLPIVNIEPETPAVVNLPSLPPPPPPPAGKSLPPPPPPPPSSRPMSNQSKPCIPLVRPRAVVMSIGTGTVKVQTLADAPPTPDVLPPPTPDTMPPPTPDYFPPPTPADCQPKAIQDATNIQSHAHNENCRDNDEPARKRRAEEQVYSGIPDSTIKFNESGGVQFNTEQLVNGNKGDGASPPKKYKM